MQTLSIQEIIASIRRQETFEAKAADNSFIIKINRYVPYACTAIHDGSQFRSELKDKISLTEYNRWYEEDPNTGDFIDSMPITLVGLDSRYEYDLNRRPEECIYDEAWGVKVWKRKLTVKERQASLTKHRNFYAVVHALVEKLTELYDSCIVYDIHSYNHQRWDRPVPLFNIGTERVDMQQFGEFVSHWQQELAKIDVPGVENQSNINDVFYGRGYNLEYITTHFPNVLVLATEVKKVYCNETTGELYPEIIRELQQQIKEAILSNAQFFCESNTKWKSKNAAHLLDKKEDKDVARIDRDLYKILKNFELLAYVNPINTAAEQRKFIRSKYTEAPKFRYSPIKINPFQLKQRLSSLKTSEISDVSVRNLYESVISSYFDKIDLLSTLGTRKFMYNSLRYFGRPSKRDLLNANYLLHLPELPSEPKSMPIFNAQDAVYEFKRGLEEYEMDCKIELSSKVISQVMVLNSKKTILIRPDATFTKKDVNALIEHEIGVHMVTTQNSSMQKLKVFNLGLPVNTKTQEGLAILSEYGSGNMTLKRLKKLAQRVIVTDMMCDGASFIECFQYLNKDLDVPTNDAFTIVTRIFRGGGFTKDYLYLNGFVRVLKLWKSNKDLTPLLVGKTSLEFYETIQEMIDRELLEKPKYITNCLKHPKTNINNPILEYVISGLK